MKAIVLEAVKKIAIKEVDFQDGLGKEDVLIAIDTVGICGSDVHYYEYGRIGPFVVKEPMILGHEASGRILEVGSSVKGLKPGDRVCMEPGIPNPGGRATRLGLYNLDPDVRFWATPPVDGCLCERVVHPAAFTFKLPENVSMAEGALVEPLAIGFHAAGKARIKPGDTALVIGAGTIGLVTALAALSGGCGRVIVADVIGEKLEAAKSFGAVIVNSKTQDLAAAVKDLTEGWGCDVVFECSGSPRVYPAVVDYVCPGGALVLVGIPVDPVPFDVARTQSREVRIETIFRYAHVYPQVLNQLASGKLDVKRLVTDVYTFDKAVEAFEYALKPNPRSIKIQIVL